MTPKSSLISCQLSLNLSKIPQTWSNSLKMSASSVLKSLKKPQNVSIKFGQIFMNWIYSDSPFYLCRTLHSTPFHSIVMSDSRSLGSSGIVPRQSSFLFCQFADQLWKSFLNWEVCFSLYRLYCKYIRPMCGLGCLCCVLLRDTRLCIAFIFPHSTK